MDLKHWFGEGFWKCLNVWIIKALKTYNLMSYCCGILENMNAKQHEDIRTLWISREKQKFYGGEMFEILYLVSLV